MVNWFNTSNNSYIFLQPKGKYVNAPLDLSNEAWDLFLIICISCLLFASGVVWYYQLRVINYLDPNTKRTRGYETINTIPVEGISLPIGLFNL